MLAFDNDVYFELYQCTGLIVRKMDLTAIPLIQKGGIPSDLKF